MGNAWICLTSRGYIKCFRCKKQKSLKRLRKELLVILCFVEQRPAYQVSLEYHLSYPTVTRIFRDIRFLLYHQCELEGRKLSETLKSTMPTSVGKERVKRPRDAAKKCGIGHVGERRQGIYQSSGDADSSHLMEVIRSKTRKGSVYHTDTFTSYNSLKQFGKHLKVNHSKTLVDKRHNHINGIEGFWSYAKHKLYNYRGVSKSNFPLYLKEMEYRYNHRKENILEPITRLYFGYVSY